METKSFFYIFFGVFALYFLSFQYSTAQITNDGADITASDIEISVSPEIPGPNENIEVSLASFLVNLDNSRISWYLDGSLKKEGSGEKKFNLTTGGLGTKQTIKAIVRDLYNASNQFEKIIIIEPSGLDVLWQTTDTYAPPFYKGKILPSLESNIKIVAIPNRKGQTTSSQKNLTYSWKRNQNNIANASGFGKQVFSFKNDYLNDFEKIEIVAREPSQNYISSSKKEIPMFSPMILFYRISENIGVDFSTALGDGVSVDSKNSILILAEPFFITPKNKNDAVLKYNWRVNNLPIGEPDYKPLISVRGDGGSGSSTIELEVKNISRLFQNAKRIIRINVLGN